MTEIPGYLSVEEVGKRLLLTYRQVLDRIGDGRIKATAVGRKYLITEEEVERYDRQRRDDFEVMPDGSGKRGESRA